jgi:hypothetical protein
VLKGYLNMSFFFYSPNFTWFAIAAAAYYLFPYDFETAKEGLAFNWVGASDHAFCHIHASHREALRSTG